MLLSSSPLPSSSLARLCSLQLLLEVLAMAAASMRCSASLSVVPSASSRCNSSSRCSTTSCSLSSAPRPQRLVSLSSSISSAPALSSPVVSLTAPASVCCQAASGDVPAGSGQVKSILCENCEGNGAVVCSQCKGDGLNSQDYFGGRFKAGTICWLCRGKKQMLCGNCNGAGFMGGFLNTQDD